MSRWRGRRSGPPPLCLHPPPQRGPARGHFGSKGTRTASVSPPRQGAVQDPSPCSDPQRLLLWSEGTGWLSAPGSCLLMRCGEYSHGPRGTQLQSKQEFGVPHPSPSHRVSPRREHLPSISRTVAEAARAAVSAGPGWGHGRKEPSDAAGPWQDTGAEPGCSAPFPLGWRCWGHLALPWPQRSPGKEPDGGAEAHPPLPSPAGGRADPAPCHPGADFCSTIPQVPAENETLRWAQAGRRNGDCSHPCTRRVTLLRQEAVLSLPRGEKGWRAGAWDADRAVATRRREGLGQEKTHNKGPRG